DLQLRILRQDPALHAPSAGQVQPEVRLPVSHSTFFGRSIELCQAVDVLQEHRLLTLTGPGGVGKTRLAVQVATELVPAHRDGTLFVDLSAVRDPGAVMLRIGDVTGGGDRPDLVIGERRMLLVLDNFEQVLAAAPSVSSLLASCPNLRLLITSRAPLRIDGERRIDVPPLAPAEASAMFVDRAEAALHASLLASEVVDSVVASLDGLPLAVELAAARVPALRLVDLRDRLADRLGTLASGRRDAPDRHRTLRRAIEWSYELLDPGFQAVLRKLSVFAGGFDIAAGLAVAETSIDGIDELVQQSLVRRTDDRYVMLESIREFAAMQAERVGESAAARDRHLEHVVDLAIATDSAGTHVEVGAAIVHLCQSERENIRAAFSWAIQQGDDHAIATLFRVIGMYWLRMGAIEEGMRWSAAAIDAAAGLDTSARMSIHLVASEFPRYGGDPLRALAMKQDAIEIGRQGRHLDWMAITEGDIAWIHALTGDFDAAEAALGAAFKLHDEEPRCTPAHLAHTVENAAEVALFEHRLDAAERFMDRLDELAGDEAPHYAWEVETALLRARLLFAKGQLGQAGPAFERVIAAAAAVEYRAPLAEALGRLAQIRASSQPAAAARLIGMADRVRAEARSPTWDPTVRDKTVLALRESLGSPTFDDLHRDGHRLPLGAVAAAAVHGQPHG
ncbi:MAG: hypothetical protein ABI620_05005, partial [Chloroflexota bacterium]